MLLFAILYYTRWNTRRVVVKKIPTERQTNNDLNNVSHKQIILIQIFTVTDGISICLLVSELCYRLKICATNSLNSAILI